MDKFKIGHLVDYFLKVNKGATSYKDLSQEDKVTLAILSVFDTKGKSVKTLQYTYERPDEAISQEEFNMTKSEYEKKAEQIKKELKKEAGNDFSKIKMPTYEDLQAMMKDDNKIDFTELHTFAREGVVQPSTAKKPEFHGLPQKAATNKATIETMKDFVSEVANDDNKYAIIEKFENMTDTEYKAFIKNLPEIPADIKSTIANFNPDTEVAFNKQHGLDGIQFNKHGQKIFRINGNAGVYESYAYASNDDTRFDTMMRYNANGYKTEYWKGGTATDKEGNKVPIYTVYSLDENEKVINISTIPHEYTSPETKKFNEFNFYQQYVKYYEELDKNEQL